MLCLLRPYLLLTQLLRKREPMGAITVAKSHRREKPNAEPKANVGFSSPHDIFPRQFAEKCVNVCGYSAQPNTAPFTPAAPLSPKSFLKKTFWRGCGKMLLRQGAFCGYSLLHAIPNQAEGACEGSPRFCNPSLARGFLVISLLGMTARTSPPADFAPLGLVRRFVEMLLQADISPCVGRNDRE